MTFDSKENTDLFTRYRNGEHEVKNIIVQNNLALVKSVAKRFMNRDVPFEDLVGTGTIGLLKAIDGFDESLGFAFSTYAFSLITGEIKRFLRDDGIIRVSRKIKKNAAIVINSKEQYFARFGKEPTLCELSALCNLSVEEITECLDACSPVKSISEPISENNDMTVGDTVTQEDCFLPLIDRMTLNQALGELDNFDRQLIFLRFYKNLTQSKTARILGVTQVSVSRREKRILSFLRTKFIT